MAVSPDGWTRRVGLAHCRLSTTVRTGVWLLSNRTIASSWCQLSWNFRYARFVFESVRSHHALDSDRHFLCACAEGKVLSLPRCQSLAHTLTSLSTHITNPLEDLQHVSCLTSMTRLQLSINFPQASQPGALDQMTAQITQITGLKALRLYNFPHSSAKSMSLGLSNLQELESAGFGPVLDVQHCTQLTCLDGEGSLKQVYLPAGQLCCLEQLSLNITSGCTLFNLGDALRLSSLTFIKQCPIDVQRVSSSTFTNSSSAGSWPLLPSLHSLRIGVMLLLLFGQSMGVCASLSWHHTAIPCYQLGLQI